jgi:hypothetical protein
VCLAGGASNLIQDGWILEGNPGDSALALPMLERQKDIFANKRGLKETDTCRRELMRPPFSFR